MKCSRSALLGRSPTRAAPRRGRRRRRGHGRCGVWAVRAPARANPPLRIVVVGAGLAELTCAYRLQQAGFGVCPRSFRPGRRTLLDPPRRLRRRSVRRARRRADRPGPRTSGTSRSLGLQLDNLLQAERNGTEPTYYFDGAPYPLRQATLDLQAVWQTIHSDVSAASYPTLYNSYTPRGYELDHMSIRDWINVSVPGGIGSRLGQLLDVAYNIEYGAETSQRARSTCSISSATWDRARSESSGRRTRSTASAVGTTRSRRACRARSPGQITLNSQLIAVRKNADGTYNLVPARRNDADGGRGSSRARIALLDTPQLGRHLTAASARSSGPRSPSRAWGRTRSSTSSS